jgi:hypothetical protein
MRTADGRLFDLPEFTVEYYDSTAFRHFAQNTPRYFQSLAVRPIVTHTPYYRYLASYSVGKQSLAKLIRKLIQKRQFIHIRLNRPEVAAPLFI